MKPCERQQVVADAQQELRGVLLDHDADPPPDLERSSHDVVAENVAVPMVGRASVVSTLSVVVLPAPFGPEEPEDRSAPHAEAEAVHGPDDGASLSPVNLAR